MPMLCCWGTLRVSHQIWVPLAVLVGIQPLPRAGGDDGTRQEPHLAPALVGCNLWSSLGCYGKVCFEQRKGP